MCLPTVSMTSILAIAKVANYPHSSLYFLFSSEFLIICTSNISYSLLKLFSSLLSVTFDIQFQTTLLELYNYNSNIASLKDGCFI